MNWYIGQEIVAIKDHSRGLIKKNDLFVIKGLQSGKCKCNIIKIDIGILYPKEGSGNIECGNCGELYKSDSNMWFSEPLFAPLDSLVNQEEINEILELVKYD